MTILIWLAFIAAAVLEVAGDALIRKGLHGSGITAIVAGFLILGCYGLMVNSVKWDFGKLLGVYIAFFALVSIAASRFVFKENVPAATWVGLGLIVVGGMVIQFGAR